MQIMISKECMKNYNIDMKNPVALYVCAGERKKERNMWKLYVNQYIRLRWKFVTKVIKRHWWRDCILASWDLSQMTPHKRWPSRL